MFGLGVPELLLILVIVVLIFGAGRLPQLGKGIGEGIQQLQAVDPRRRGGRREQEGLSGRTSPRSKSATGTATGDRSPGGRPAERRFQVKKAALMLLAVAVVASVAACGKKPAPAPPPPPPPVAPEAPPPAPPPAPRPEVKPQVDEYARLRAMSAEEIEKSGLLAEVFFDFDRADIRDADRATLAKNADALKRFDFLRVTVEGHCDERGTVEYNLALGERRARAAYDYLVSLGVRRRA